MESKALRDERGGVAISVAGLRKLFPNGGQSLEVLTDATFSRQAGEKVAIIGESGSGKSTLLSLIAGLDTPDGGSIEVGAETIHELDEDGLTRYRSTTVGLVFQFHYLLRDFSAIENVMLPAMIGSVERSMRRPRSCWSRWAWAIGSTTYRRSFPAANGNASHSRDPSLTGRLSCSPTSRRVTLTIKTRAWSRRFSSLWSKSGVER